MATFDRLIDLQRRDVTRDSYGGEIVTWSHVDTVWASVRTRGQTAETWEAGSDREVATRTAAMRLRWRDDIDETMRVVYDGLAWDIEGIAEVGFRRETEIYCVADTGSGSPHVFTVMGGLSADAVPEASEITIAGSGNRIDLPPHVDKHHLVWRLATERDLRSVVLASDTTQLNQIGAYFKYVDVDGADILVTVGGEEGKVWVTNQQITHAAETLVLA